MKKRRKRNMYATHVLGAARRSWRGSRRQCAVEARRAVGVAEAPVGRAASAMKKWTEFVAHVATPSRAPGGTVIVLRAARGGTRLQHLQRGSGCNGARASVRGRRG